MKSLCILKLFIINSRIIFNFCDIHVHKHLIFITIVVSDIRTPSRSSWDDEDSTPSRSKWEMPSPSRSISEDMRSERR